MNNKNALLLSFVLLLASLQARAAESTGGDGLSGDELVVSDDAKFVLGTGIGIVRFDVNSKVTDKQTGGGWYIDLEGNLDLAKWSKVRNFYVAYQLSEKHSLLFSYFDVERKSTLLDIDENFEDLVLINAEVEVRDRSKFYGFAYGYSLFRDNHSDITLIAGIDVIDLNFEAEANGTITVEGDTRSGVDLANGGATAPLPLIGLNFNNRFTPKWSLATKIAFVSGRHEEVSAIVLSTNIISRYQFSRNLGLLLGLTYFTADVENDRTNQVSEISYQYNGLFLGLHLGI